MYFSNVLSLFCGIAFFLFGMSLMGTGLKRVAGPKMETYLWHLSSTPVKGFALGTFVAAVIQSSGATSVMAVSFVNAGMMKFTSSINSLSPRALLMPTASMTFLPRRGPAGI